MSAPMDLLPQERILWHGYPVRRRLWRRTDVVYVPFSALWTGFIALLVVLVLSQGRRPGVMAYLLLLVGSYLMFARFIVRAVAWRRTRYVVTDRRVVVVGGLSGRWTRSQYLHALPPPVIAERADGSGSLAFGEFPRISDGGKQWSRSSGWASEPGRLPVLWDVAEVRHVRDVVASVQAAYGSR